MDEKQTRFVGLVRHLADAIEGIDESELEKVLAGKHVFEVRVVTRRDAQEKKPPPKLVDVKTVLRKLEECENRESARALLQETLSTRNELEQLARGLDIQVSKQDRLEGVRDKIVEATIGALLRSRAIQGIRP